jgi:nucleotide-binding universal stress UspA family protein
MTPPESGPVVVGVDASTASRHAIDLAAAHATTLRTGLTLLHALDISPSLDALMLPDVIATLQSDADSLVERLATKIREDHPDLAVTGTVRTGRPAAVLIDASRDARLLVLGCRGEGGFAELLLGSVSSQVAGHAHGPVIVVRPTDRDSSVRPDAPIIVGVDGSPSNQTAIGYAFDTAHRLGRDLIAVNCWAPSAGLLQDYSEQEILADEAEAAVMLTASVKDWHARYPEVVVKERSVRHGYAESYLIELSAQASLIVVGSRGRGGFAGLVLGSVSQALLHHAHCPVAVIHTRH